jgi:hypothetical protein
MIQVMAFCLTDWRSALGLKKISILFYEGRPLSRDIGFKKYC